jgi:hypothetical protein
MYGLCLMFGCVNRKFPRSLRFSIPIQFSRSHAMSHRGIIRTTLKLRLQLRIVRLQMENKLRLSLQAAYLWRDKAVAYLLDVYVLLVTDYAFGKCSVQLFHSQVNHFFLHLLFISPHCFYRNNLFNGRFSDSSFGVLYSKQANEEAAIQKRTRSLLERVAFNDRKV